VTKDLKATVTVLANSTATHSPVIGAIKVNRVTPTQKTLKRRNFKALERPALIPALEAWPWLDVYGIRDPDKVLDFVTKGIVNGLDLAAPSKSIKVKEGLLPLYLCPDTLALMAKRDSLGRGPRYKAARNRVNALVRRDKEASSLAKFTDSGNLPAVLWEIANAAVGKPRQPLPTSVTRADGTITEGNLEAANAVNTYYMQKVLKIRTGRGVQNTSQKAATTSGTEIREDKYFLVPHGQRWPNRKDFFRAEDDFSPRDLHGGEQHPAHVPARVQEGEVMHHGECHSQCGLGRP
jgi:hypothetical protein